ncbi:MAG: DUF2156 domain-containing protein [Clostridiales bacterium]|nr:DUF2156 domain-containing protein [Clostridiales bacterium]
MFERLLRHGHRGALEYNFTSNFIWREIYKLQFSQFQGNLIIMSNEEEPTFIFPSGVQDVTPIVRAIYDHVSARKQKLVFNTLLEEDRVKLAAAFPGKFLIEPIRDAYDYLYEADRLITLTGKKLSAKRNHINRFKAMNTDWSYENITPDNIDEAHEMSLIWCKLAGCTENADLFDESCAVEQAFNHFFDLGLTGGILRADGKIIAFAMGQPLNENTYLIHIEKAFHDIQGAYQLINQQFAEANCKDFQYINREDDAGDEGLRRAKLSYYPADLVVKYKATLLTTL